jgi:hypothetical protein
LAGLERSAGGERPLQFGNHRRMDFLFRWCTAIRSDKMDKAAFAEWQRST